MLFENISVLDQNLDCIDNCYVGVKGSAIAYIGKEAPKEDFGQKYNGLNKLLMPGMYNAHGHSTMTLLRGYAENLPLQRWLSEMVWPFEGNIIPDAALPASYLSIAEMLRFGTVSFSDMYVWDDERLQAVTESGIKANLSHGVLAFDPNVEYKNTPSYSVCDKLVDDYNGAADGRIKIELAPHAEYDVSEKVIRGIAEHALEKGVGIQIHVSETKSEHEECMQRHNGMTPTAYLESLGLLDSPTTAAHCVWATDEDLQILKNHDASVATCPASNLKLGSGIPNTMRFMSSGINLSIGTDGASSNNSLNLFRDMYLAAIACRGASLNPVGIEAKDVLRAATSGGAYAQRREGCGSIAVGNKADLVVLDLDLPWMQPITDVVNNVVYAATGTEVVLTMVDGKVLYDNGEYTTIDVEKAISETQAGKDAIVRAVNESK